MPPRVALATCQILPEPDHDEPLLLAELARVGIDAEIAAWDDPNVDWGAFDACVIRSTWNYHLSPVEFRKWIETVSAETTLLNSADIVSANINKSYLWVLAKNGIEIVPTMIFKDIAEFDQFHLSRFVLKPAVSAGSHKTKTFNENELDEAKRFASDILCDGDLIVQPFIWSVDMGGEIAWSWIDGEVTHGIRKLPRFSEDDESVSDGFAPTAEDLERLAPILAQIDSRCLYARIDVMEHEGKWLLSELELIEPSLFFKQYPEALERFSGALLKRFE